MFTGIDGLNKILKVCESALTKNLLFTSPTTPSEGWIFRDELFEIANGSSTLSLKGGYGMVGNCRPMVRSRFYQMFLNSLSRSYILCEQLLYCLKAKMGFWVIRNMVSWNFNKRNSHYRFCKWLHWCSGGCFETVVGTFAYVNIADHILSVFLCYHDFSKSLSSWVQSFGSCMDNLIYEWQMPKVTWYWTFNLNFKFQLICAL